ncbi:beta-hydroxyacyl-[acyl-carrier-protein] dehydratase subunit HadB [Burkholderiales bacterium GJ-E10]|nr:beta-hydroxyacyl-[acyl-carrier-protein] dehydratase subunit HadB [Burkholderiales bacterium GJ-E10]
MACPRAGHPLGRFSGLPPRLARGLLYLGLGALLPAAWGEGLLGVLPSGSASPASSVSDGKGGDLAPSDREAIRRWSQEQRSELVGTVPPGAVAGSHDAAAGGLTPEQRKVLRDQIRAQQRWNPEQDGSAR